MGVNLNVYECFGNELVNYILISNDYMGNDENCFFESFLIDMKML